jgi:membrane fusion protein (multidrug efflux system)
MRLPTSRQTLRRTAIAFALAALLAACGPRPDDAATEAEARVSVEAVSAERRDVAASYAGTAALTAPGEAQVVAKTSGVLLTLMAEEGDVVEAGQVLARIDPDRLRLDLARNEANLRKLESNYRRSQELLAERLVSQEANDQIRFDLDAARAAYDMARLELSYTEIRAPISGVIAERLVKTGNLIQLNASLFRIVDTSRLEAVLNVPERELATLRPGLPVQLAVDAVPGRVFTGVVDRVSPVVDAGSGTFRVTCAFEGGDALRPGMFGRIQAVYDTREDALAIPRDALMEDAGEVAVFAVVDGRARRVSVRTGHSQDGWVEVLEGLEDGARVVTAGKNTLRDGVGVQVIGDPAPAAEDAAAETGVAAGEGAGDGGAAAR